jgi:hypothetical protein
MSQARSSRMRAWDLNRKTMRGLGIQKIDFDKNVYEPIPAGQYRLTLVDGEEVYVQVPICGSTEATVLAKAAQMLKDRPVRYA